MNMYSVPNPEITGCPPGLEYLTQVDQLLIKQKVELVEALVGFESNNKYEVRNSMGQNVFYAVEENDCLSRQCCGPMRSFAIHILTMDEVSKIGKISKQWTGLLREAFTDSDNFGIQFPMDLDDFMFFETTN
ncbi:hypothetical protein FQN60_013674 [Etheostoma spectabile]|uniref:Phospholipid scramblase n=1 Tax=Etheostoma spectabile TaxID=54343 RepID=A0A5J5CJM2_9PERO|nr:hypothetical protein FQN60_013674 [Etheostoma spectabile]